MKLFYTLLLSLIITLGFTQNNSEQLTFFFGEVVLVSKSGDTLSVPLQVTGQMYTVTPEGDTLSFISLDSNSTADDAVWPASKLSNEFTTIYDILSETQNTLIQLDNRLVLYNQTTGTKFDQIDQTLSSLQQVTGISDTVIIHDTVYVPSPVDTTVVDPTVPPVVNCDDPLSGLKLLLVDVNTGDTLRTLKQTDTINKADGKFSIIVVSCDNSAIKGVTFFLDGVKLRREGVEPYAINGDNNGIYTSWNPSIGTYELKSEVESKTWSQPNRIFSTTLTIVDGIGGITPTTPVNPTTPTTPTTPVIGGQFCEVNGLVTIEAESLDISGTGWAVKTTEPGYSGTGYLSYEGRSDYFNNPGNDVITAKINITNPGVYEFKWRNQAGKIHTTEENDTWLRFPDADDFYALKNGTQLFKPVPDCNSDPNANCPKGASNNGWFKVYVNSLNWQWYAGTSDNGPATEIFARFDKPGIYTMEISARSRHHFIDKIVLYNNNLINESSTQSLTSPQTICEGTTIPTNPVNPTTPNGFFDGDRIALVHDGNTADADDHGGITLSLGMIKWAGLVDNLVFVGHSCIYKSPCNTTFLNGNDLPYNFTDWCNIMKVTTDDVMAMIGSNIPVYSFKDDWDDNRQLDVSVPALAAQMNASSSTSKLWVSCAGPMDVIYRALQQTDPSKLQYIHLVSHSSWNETSTYGGLNYNWASMKRDFPQVNFHDILDQNKSNGDKDFKEEGKPTKLWNWMLLPNGGDQLSDYIHRSNNDGFMSNKGNFEIDWSDAGMVYWIISGGSNGGCENCGTVEVEKLFRAR